MPLSLPKRFPLCILASSVCKSLQCLISTLTQGGRGGHLFRLTCTEEHCKQTTLEHVGSAHSVWATLCLPPLMASVLSWSTLLRFQVALQGKCIKQARGCLHFPGLKLLRFRFSGTPQRHRLSQACILCHPRFKQLR